ncbi:MAG: T9SS type A sorting domain-containing protein [Bacteroidetes bacterium]|nr:T9SS type A sorting domain-containing protein [Bacteroidota bacterium]MBP7397983.1 T9SS type A sorting domain-containing protein [Chitinophagales bacterium]MBP8754808.1 T9SS type A sorting domain-containing protein [Chitinophagales bacterium]MBP9188324.1 T9SS type A sorting domain-containing protein [Chitinophagales bacterium]MBP9549852.1 T9SS type A sorting domain-containing protein [Chitinophagales bacterium]
MKRFLLPFFLLLTQQILFAQLPPWNAKFIVYHPDGFTDTVWVGCDETATDGFDIGLDSLDNSFDYPISIGAFSPEVDAEFGLDNCLNLKREILPFADVRQYTFYILYDDAPGLPSQIKWDSTDFLYEAEEYKIAQATFVAQGGYIYAIDNTVTTFMDRNNDNPDDIFFFIPSLDVYAETTFFECDPQNNVLKLRLDVTFDDYTLNVDNINIEYSFTVFPTVVKNDLFIETESDKQVYITLFNITGERVYFSRKIINKQIKLNVSNLVNGIYFLQLTNTKTQKREIHKFIKN